MQKPSEHHKLTSDNNIIKFKKPVHDPFKPKDIVYVPTTVLYSKHSMFLRHLGLRHCVNCKLL